MTEGEGKTLSAAREQKVSQYMVYSKHLWTSRNVTEQQKSKGQNTYACSCFCYDQGGQDCAVGRFNCHSEMAGP